MAADATRQLPDDAPRLLPRDPAEPSPVPVRTRRFGRSLPDARLVQRVRTGDVAAFEVLFDRYHRPLLAFCRHMLGTREEAEDALQQVFVAAHRHLTSGTKVAELRPWLYAIARNRCLSVLRARKEALALDDVPEAVGAGLAVAHEVEQRQDLREVLEDLAALPHDQRAALVLSELGALSHEEIAAVLEVRKEKVKALVFQAREALAGRREARDTDCRVIREQLANLRGGALRRAPLRRHLEVCDGCRAFRGEVRRQREAMAMLLPVVPTVALKAKVVGAVAGGTALPAAATVTAAGVGTGLAAKALAVAAIAGTAGGGYTVARDAADRPRAVTEVVAPAALPASPEASATTAPVAALPDRSARDAQDVAGARKSKPAKPAASPNAPGRVQDRPGRARGRDGVPGPPAHSNNDGGKGDSEGASALAPRGRPAQPGRESAPGQVKGAEERRPVPPRPTPAVERQTKPVQDERQAKPAQGERPVPPAATERVVPAKPELPGVPGLTKKVLEDTL